MLKKAVLEEQTRNAELRDILKEKEQILRKAEQEMDSLTFRNQQLTKMNLILCRFDGCFEKLVQLLIVYFESVF